MLADFHTLPEQARIWLYACEKVLTQSQQDYILNVISEELKGWNAHKQPLTAGVAILENHFIVVALVNVFLSWYDTGYSTLSGFT